MASTWEALSRKLASSPPRLRSSSCIKSVKIHGLPSVKLDFFPDDRLLRCRSCGVTFLYDKAASHYDSFPKCKSGEVFDPDLLPYHALNILQRLYEQEKSEKKAPLKRTRSDAMRKTKLMRNLGQSSMSDNSSFVNSSDHPRKRAKLKSRGSNLSVRACDKVSSSSSYDQFSTGEVNSPGSGTESSGSAPSKMVENPTTLNHEYPTKGILEIVEEVSCDFLGRTQSLCGTLPKPPSMHQMGRSAGAGVQANGYAQSYPSSPASPQTRDRKEATYVPPNVLSSRKHVKVKSTPPPEATEPLQARSMKPSSASESLRMRYHHDYNKSFKEQSQTSTSASTRSLPPAALPLEGTVDLVSNSSPSSGPEVPQGYDEEAAEAVYHLEQETRKQAPPLSRPIRNGGTAGVTPPAEYYPRSWEAAGQMPSWHRNTTGDNFYGDFMDVEPARHHFEKQTFNSGYVMAPYGQPIRSTPPSLQSSRTERSRELAASGRVSRQSDVSPLNLLTQCGCLDMRGVRCRNSLLCPIHSYEEKRKVQRPRDFEILFAEARRLQQQHLRRETPAVSKLRRLPSASSTSMSVNNSSAMDYQHQVTSSSGSSSSSLMAANSRSASVASTSSASARLAINGGVEGRSHQQQPSQTPTILHRRVLNPSTLLLRRNRSLWMPEKRTSMPGGGITVFAGGGGGGGSSSGGVASSSGTSVVAAPLGPPPTASVPKSRVVVNDEHEKSITGRARRFSRSGMRQQAAAAAAAMHQSAYLQHMAAISANPSSSTTVKHPPLPPLLLRANQMSSKVRVAPGRGASGATSTAWIACNRAGSSSGTSAVASATRHSLPSATAAATGTGLSSSDRLIVIGNNGGSANRLTVVPNLNVFQGPSGTSLPQSLHRRASLHSRVSRFPTTTAAASSVNMRHLNGGETHQPQAPPSMRINDAYGEEEGEEDEGTAAVPSSSSPSTFVSEGAGGDVAGHSHSKELRAPPSACEVPTGQMLVFQTRRM